MSFPFGGHPTLRQYLDWAITAGCTIARGIWSDHYLIPHHTLTIDGPNGGWVSIIDPDEGEHLAPSEVSRYDRRLGVSSPFPGSP
jgi:hypothetical protein